MDEIKLKWVEYDKFEDVEYLAKGGFGTTFKAVWNDGPWKSNYFNCKLERKGETRVALKCLHNSQDITADFLKEVGSSISVFYIHGTIRCLDPLKRPNAEELQELIEESYNNRNNTVFYKQIEDADEINKKPSSTAQSPLSSTSTLSYISHPEAVYTKHSESIKVDFTKLNINSEDCN
ncbi:kinase-like domain-containing protein [Rhizophagus irregularis DAOM 181602=DAOM 197198]|nr:kinase-like domain-containing protein [Rhizophagus irregularis DAOM 181602=DAOM 197198]